LVLEKGISLEEILKWDLEDLFKAHAMIQMKQDYEAARANYEKKEFERMREKK
jgi:hypothetical protein